MTRDQGFHEYVMSDLLNNRQDIRSRGMFGGWGLYQDGIIFGIIVGDKLYCKVGEGNKNDYETIGSKPFTYTGHNGKAYEMSYWEVPEEIMENREEFEMWIAKAVNESLKAKKKKK